MPISTLSVDTLVCSLPGCERRLHDHRNSGHDFKAAEADLDRLPKSQYVRYLDIVRDRIPQIDPNWARETRIAAGLTQLDVADELGVHASLLCRWEKGYTRPISIGRANRWLWTIQSLDDGLTDERRRKRDDLLARSAGKGSDRDWS